METLGVKEPPGAGANPAPATKFQRNFVARLAIGGPQQHKTARCAVLCCNRHMYTVYILLSQKDQRTYVGYTKDLMKRLHEHNSGRVHAIKQRRPFAIFYTEQFDTVEEAKQRELWWKSGSGRKNLKKLFERRML